MKAKLCWLALSFFILTACSTNPVSEVVKPEPSNTTSIGGMVKAGKDFDAEKFLSTPLLLSPQAVLPSCSRKTYTGNSGTISVQTSTAGTVAWGIYMINPVENAGRWRVSVFVNGVVEDKKDQLYPPHGSLPRSKAKRGATLSIASVHTSLIGITYYTTTVFRMPAEFSNPYARGSVKVASLAAMLKTQLENVIPADFHIALRGDELGVFYKGVHDVWLGLDLGDKTNTDHEYVELIVTSILSSVQDVIAHNTAKVWPTSEATEGQQATDLPLLDSRWNDRRLDVWFGSEQSPVLRLDPIYVDDLKG